MNNHPQSESRSNSIKKEDQKYDYTDYDKSLEDPTPADNANKEPKDEKKDIVMEDVESKEVKKQDVVNDDNDNNDNEDGDMTVIHKDIQVDEPIKEETVEEPIENDTVMEEQQGENTEESSTNNEDADAPTDQNGTIDSIITDSFTEKDTDVEMTINEPHIEEPVVKMETLDRDTSLIDYSQVPGDIFPMREPELKAWELKHQPLVNKSLWLKHLNTTAVNDFTQYKFLDSNFLIFKQADAFTLYKFFSSVDTTVTKKVSMLTNEWAYRSKLWHSDQKFYDKQIQDFYQTNDPKKEEEKKLDGEKPKGGRRNRHGDSVRTEAEFMEILKSLEQERERDPLVRAQYGAATIPDMILDPMEKFQYESFVDLNNLEIDNDRWANRVLTDPIDNFTAEEHQKFIQAYLMYPKRFGKISQHMGGFRTSEDCVLHYYRTKKDANYKQLIINKNKKNKKSKLLTKKPKKLIKGSKGSNSASEIENSGTPLEDTSGEFFVESRKRKTGITVPIKKRSISESMLNDDTPEPETEPPVDSNVNNNDSNNEFASNATVAIAIASQTVQDSTVQPSLPTSPQQSVLPAAPTPTQPQQQSTTTATAVQNDANGGHEEKKRKKRRTEEGHSSYWSVQEINKFPLLLQEFGSDWDEISKVLKTKTAAMARNYYQRSLNDHPDWRSFVINGDANKTSKPVAITEDQPPQPTVSEITPASGGPPVGLFYKKPSSYTSSTVTTEQQQQQPVATGTAATATTKSTKSVDANQAPAPQLPPQFVHSTPIVEVKTEMNEIPKPPIRASIRSLLNSDDVLSTATVVSTVLPLTPIVVKQQQSPQQPESSEIKSLAPPPILTNMASSQAGYPNLVNGQNAGINGLAAVAGLYANSTTSPEVVKEEFKSMMSQQQQQQQPDILPQPTQQQAPPPVKQNNMSALNALAKVAFEQN